MKNKYVYFCIELILIIFTVTMFILHFTKVFNDNLGLVLGLISISLANLYTGYYNYKKKGDN